MRLAISLLLILFILAGCSDVKTYIYKRDRVDQEMGAGNRGYIYGTPPPAESREGLERTIIGVDVEIPILPWEKGEVSVPPKPSSERVEQPPIEEEKTIFEIPEKKEEAIPKKTAIRTEDMEHLK